MSTPAKSVSDSSSSNSVRRLLDLRSCNDLATRESEGGDRESVPSRTVSTPAKSVSDGSSSNSVRRLLDLRSCNDLVTRESEVGDRESVPSTNKAVPRRGCVFGEALETAAVETKDRACQTAGVGQSDVKLTNGEVFFITEVSGTFVVGVYHFKRCFSVCCWSNLSKTMENIQKPAPMAQWLSHQLTGWYVLGLHLGILKAQWVWV